MFGHLRSRHEERPEQLDRTWLRNAEAAMGRTCLEARSLVWTLVARNKHNLFSNPTFRFSVVTLVLRWTKHEGGQPNQPQAATRVQAVQRHPRAFVSLQKGPSGPSVLLQIRGSETVLIVLVSSGDFPEGLFWAMLPPQPSVSKHDMIAPGSST